jgi:hypothetical protein
MRPQQQNRRMRGRNGGGNNNNRKGPNPLTRSYESNGPDVKIRGSAQQIAEKYAQLARDAQGSGDRVMAENYLQHAEHYNRIIAAAQAQMPIQNMQAARDMSDDDLDEDRDDYETQTGQGARPEQPQPAPGGEAPPVNLEAAPQPVIEGTPAEVALNADQDGDGGRRHDRHQQNASSGDFEGGHRRPRRPRRGGHRPGMNGETAENAGQPAEDAAQPSGASDEADAALLGVDD